MAKRVFIPVSEPALDDLELKYITDCVKSGWVSSLGKYISEFEANFASFSDSKYGVSVFNGTVALHLALVALGIGPGDEVIVPTLTFVATPNSVLYTGAKPVFVDSEPETWNIDPKEIEKKITKKTKAIIAVHLYGHPANMGEILKIAKKYNIIVIEDAAEAHGAKYLGKKVGSIGDLGCFSFYGNKIITTGEGGIIVCKNKKLAQRMHFLKDHAMSKMKRYFHPELGFNYRITNLQAALGVAQLQKIETFLKRKKEIADQYTQQLTGVPGIIFQKQAVWAEQVFWMYSILVKPSKNMNRDKLMEELKQKGIDSRPFFVLNNKMPYFSKEVRSEKFPIAQKLSDRGMNLPSSVLLTNDEVKYICDSIKKILQ